MRPKAIQKKLTEKYLVAFVMFTTKSFLTGLYFDRIDGMALQLGVLGFRC
jgi:hypothetical protein